MGCQLLHLVYVNIKTYIMIISYTILEHNNIHSVNNCTMTQQFCMSFSYRKRDDILETERSKASEFKTVSDRVQAPHGIKLI